VQFVVVWAASVVASGAASAQSSGHSVVSASDPSADAHASVTRIPAAPDSGRAYESQALRFESSWGNADIIRGANGEVLGTVGWFRGLDVSELVKSSPRALTEARKFETRNFRGSLVTAIGATTLGIGILVAGNNANNASTPILIIGGAGAIGWGLQQINAGYAALSKAFWWYNRDLSH
jgi:hypothetical protein